VTGSATSSFTGGITASALGLTGGLTLSGGSLLVTSTATSTWSGGLSVTGLTVTGGMIVSGGSLNVTSTASSTWAGGINLTGGCFAINGVCQGGTGGGSGTVNSGAANAIAYYPSTGTTVDDATGLNWDNSNTRLGIGTSTPGTSLSVQGAAVISGQLNAAGLTATGTVLLALGSANINNPTVGIGTTSPWGFVSIEPSTTTVSATTPIFVIADKGTTTPFFLVSGNNGNIGVGSTTPWGQLSINNLAGAANPLFVVATSTEFQRGTTTTTFIIDSIGRVGIGGTTSPSEQLVITGNISNITASGSAPILKGSTVTAADPQSMVVQGHMAYVVNSSSQVLQIFSIATSSPSYISTTAISGASPAQVFVAGKYAYVVTNSGNTFEIYDVSDSATTTRTTSFAVGSATGPKSVYVSGRYAYIVNSAGSTIQVLDVSDPFSVSRVASIATNATPQYVYVTNGFAYVTTDSADDTLQIFDVRNPHNPVSVGSLTLAAGSDPEAVYVSGRYAYIANTGTDSLQIIDVSNPYGPSSVSVNPAVGSAYSVSVNGRYAYVGTGLVLQVFDVYNPNNVKSLGTAAVRGTEATSSVAVSGRFAYVANAGAATIQAYDVGGTETTAATIHSLEAGTLQVRNELTAYGNLSITGGVNIGTGGILSAGPISVLGTTTVPAYVAASFGNRVGVGSSTPWGLLSVESISGISSTATPIFVVADSGTTTPSLLVHGGSGNVGIGSTTPWAQLSINNQAGATTPLFAVSTSTSVAAGFSTAFLIDQVGRVGIGGTTTLSEALAVQGNIANLASSSTPPKFLTSVSVQSNPTSVSVSGRNIYLTSYTNNVLQIFDYSTSSPAHLGTAPLSGINGQAVTVSGRYAYVTSGGNETLSVVDVSSLARPTTTISTNLSTANAATTSVSVAGKFAYVVNSTANTLKMVDISTTTPYVIAPAPTLGSPQDVFVHGRYVYVVTGTSADTTDALQVFDISTSTPILAGTLTLAGGTASPSAVYVSGRYAYITNTANDTLEIVDVSNPNSPVSRSTITTDDNPTDVFVVGRYAYVTSSLTNTLQVYDVFNPLSPRRLGASSTGLNPASVYVAGKYAYIVNFGDSTLQVWDIGGLETTSAIIHSLEAGNLQVRNDLLIQGTAQITTGLNVGNGGILSHGPISVMATSTVPGFVSAFFGNNVGIGTSTPAGRLSVQNNDATFPAVLIRADGAGDGNIAIAVDANDNCVDSSAAAACSLNDVAELFRISEPVAAGELVMLDPERIGQLKKASSASVGGRNLLAGVISTSPAIVFEGSGLKAMGGIYKSASDKAPLALAGRVPVKVNLEGGEIVVGDPITISSIAGVGARATSSGKIIGYALDNFTEEDALTGDKILVLAQTGYWISGAVLEAFNTPQVSVRVVESAQNWLAELNIVFEKGLIKVKEIIVELLTANRVITEQFTTDRLQLKDAASGDSYCVRIVNGEWQKTKGDCATAIVINAPIGTPTTSSEATNASAVNTQELSATSTPASFDAATTTAPVTEQPAEGLATSTPDAITITPPEETAPTSTTTEPIVIEESSSAATTTAESTIIQPSSEAPESETEEQSTTTPATESADNPAI
jgi:hypothetical protein